MGKLIWVGFWAFLVLVTHIHLLPYFRYSNTNTLMSFVFRDQVG